MDKKMEDCHYFTIDFVTVKDNLKGRLFSTCNDTIEIDIGGFTDLELCNTDYISDEYIFLGSKERFIDLKKGDAISIDNNPVIITDIDKESINEFNRFWEDAEMQEWDWASQ